MIYLQLFLNFMVIGVLTLGGGYAALPLIQSQIVEANGWITMAEFSDLITISEITPGVISINAATFVGTKVAGIPGAVCATLGFVVLPFALVSIFYFLYRKYRKMNVMQGVLGGLRPAVVALIASAGLSILILALWGEGGVSLANTNILSIILFAAAFLVMRRWRTNPILIILGCGVVGAAVEGVSRLF